MKFSVDVPYTKVLVFRKAVEAFVKERPREFIGEFIIDYAAELQYRHFVNSRLFLFMTNARSCKRISRDSSRA